MVNLDIQEEDMEKYLHPSMDDFGDPHKLMDAERAASLLQNAVETTIK